MASRDVLGADPEGKLRLEACCGPDREATPVEMLPGVVMRCSVAVTCEEARAPLGREPQRPWSDRARARTTPVLWVLFARVTVLALRWGPDGPMPVPVTAC